MTPEREAALNAAFDALAALGAAGAAAPLAAFDTYKVELARIDKEYPQ